MRRLLPLLASLVLLALPASASAYTFAEWDQPGHPAGIAQSGTFLYSTLSSTGQIGQGTLNGVQTALTVGGGSTFQAPVTTAYLRMIQSARRSRSPQSKLSTLSSFRGGWSPCLSS